jgi:ATP-dependent protease ClpP protease subunit
VKIKIKGVIISNDWKWIYDLFEMESTCPKDIDAQIETAKGEDLEVEINSGGGDVYAGSEIFTALKAYSGDVVVKILGLAASAASVIAMAGKKVIISPTAQIMIHNVWSRASGDYRDMEHEAGVLKGWNKSIANSYMLKTGMSQEELLRLMNKETWMTAQEALENKFADEIMFDEGLQLAASFDRSGLLPKEVIDKLMNARAEGKLGIKDIITETIKTEDPRQAPVDLYTKLYENLERRARI